jgi:hypothetical protein
MEVVERKLEGETVHTIPLLPRLRLDCLPNIYGTSESVSYTQIYFTEKCCRLKYDFCWKKIEIKDA